MARTKKPVVDDDEAAVDHGDGGGTDGWSGVMDGIFERSREDRSARISEWATLAGPPHAEVLIGDDPECMERVGFWRVPGGIIRIRANRKGEFDPAERTDITAQEAKAIADAMGHPAVTSEQADAEAG